MRPRRTPAKVTSRDVRPASPRPVHAVPQRKEKEMTGNFEGRKLIVVGGSSGMGKATAASVIADGGSAVIIGRDQGRVDETVAELGKQGKA